MRFSRISARTSSWPKLVHPHIVLALRSPPYSSPRHSDRMLSTSPVHDPQEADALVTPLTSSRLVSPPSTMARVIGPLHTPLQPQISAVSGRAATAALGSRPSPPSANAWPKISTSRIAPTSSRFFRRAKYQLPSAVSP